MTERLTQLPGSPRRGDRLDGALEMHTAQGVTNSQSTMLATILKTQNARYWLLSGWGIALVPVVGLKIAVAWWVATMFWAGWLRGRYERFVAARNTGSWEKLPLVALTSGVFWAAGPWLAWQYGSAFGAPLAWLMLASGYQLTFTQLGHTPQNAIIVTLPYTAVAIYMLSTVVGADNRLAAFAALPVLYGGLYFSVFYGQSAHKKIREGLEDQARLAALRYQVQPHFLFNTLNSLSSLIVNDRRQEAEVMLQDLSDFFRQSLLNAPKELTTLDQEIEIQRRYLSIQQARFPNRLSVRFAIDERTLKAVVPSLILQSLVENAITHGLERSEGRIVLEVGSCIRGRQLSVWIEDDARSNDAPRPGLGFGLKNVSARLEAHYDGQGTLRAGAAGPGWRSEISLPFEVEPCA